ncbi:MAG TPA: HNH endonuclease signature motif containing protein [Candidatus Bathyarchaeia archaeon]|nr:HNH endonuclease signature motif containing protein [Candidatus Bathyarchaeia archaeon]
MGKRSSRIDRTGDYIAMAPWLAEQSSREKCAVCNQQYGRVSAEFILAKQVIDHIFPVRFLLSMHLDPHITMNTLSCCQSCHARKLQHETLIFAGDVLGFLRGLKRIGYPMERVITAARFYGFAEVDKFSK